MVEAFRSGAVGVFERDQVGFAEGGTLILLEADMNFAGTATSPSFVPEPSSLVLIGSGMLGVAGVLRRKLKP